MDPLFPELDPALIDNQNSEVREQIRRLEKSTPEDIARQELTTPDLNSIGISRGFRLHYGEVSDRPGTRYNMLGQKIYEPPTLAMESQVGFYEPVSVRANVSLDQSLQVRAVNAIDSINYGRSVLTGQQRTVTSGLNTMFGRQFRSLMYDQQVRAAGLMGLSREDTRALLGEPAVREGLYQDAGFRTPSLESIMENMGTGMPSAERISDINRMGFYADRYADPESVQKLYREVNQLKNALGDGIKSVEKRYAYRKVNGMYEKVLVGLKVGVRNYNDLFDGMGLYSGTSAPAVERETAFNFTVDSKGQVIELNTNRVISGSLMALGPSSISTIVGSSLIGGEGRRQSSSATALGLLATYARSSELEARHGVVDGVFNTMIAQGEYGALGRVFAEALVSRNEKYVASRGLKFGEVAGQMLSSVGHKDFKKGIHELIESISYRGLEYYSSLHTVFKESFDENTARMELFRNRQSLLTAAFDPLLNYTGGEGSRFDGLIDTTMKRVVDLIQSDSSTQRLKIAGQDVDISLFDDLKVAALNMSPTGRSAYDLRKSQVSRSILQLMMSPFLMPHESGYSGSQSSSRLGLFAMSETRGQRGMYELFAISPSKHTHGMKSTKPGEYYKPIGSQSDKSSVMKYIGGFYKFDDTAAKVAEFYETKTLFAGMPSLKRAKLDDIQIHMQKAGYKSSREIIEKYRAEMQLKEDKDIEVLLMPFRKPEQISQRLKNLVGGRPMLEIATGLRRAVMSQSGQQLRSYFSGGDYGVSLDMGKALSGNIPAALNDIQYQRMEQERSRIIAELGLDEKKITPRQQSELSRLLTSRMREIETQFNEGGGYIQGKAARLTMVGMGVNMLSDFMLVNQEYVNNTAFGYLHHSKFRVSATQNVRYEGVGRVTEADPYFDWKTNRLAEVFKAGTSIYLSPTPLKNERAMEILKKTAQSMRSEFLARGISKRESDAQVRRTLQSNFKFLESVDIKDGEVTNATMRAGAYSFDGDDMRFQGELVGSSLRLGMLPTNNRQRLGDTGLSGATSLDFFDVKIPGVIRSTTGGMVTVADDVNFSPSAGGYTAEINYMVLTNDWSRSSSLVKGPTLGSEGEAFWDRGRQQAIQKGFVSRQTLSQGIFGLLSPAAFKGYNYEAGLDILRDAESRRDLLAIPADQTAFLLGIAFMEKGERGQRLKAAMREYAKTQSLGSAVGLLLEDVNSGSSIEKMRNLMLSTPDIIEFAGGQSLDRMGEYLAQRFETGDFDPIKKSLNRLVGRALEKSTQMEQYVEGQSSLVRTFQEGDFSVRSAGLITDVINTTRQLVYDQLLVGDDPLQGYALVDKDKGARVDRFIEDKDFRAATLDIAQKMGVRSLLPSQLKLEGALNNLKEGDELYSQVESMLYLMHGHFKTSHLVLRTENILPSRILVAAGSEDAVALEFHYSLNLSKREFGMLRGTGVDMEKFTDLQAAYGVVATHGSANSTSRMMQVISPFSTDKTQAGVAKTMSRLIEGYNDFSGKFKFLGSVGNLSLLDEVVRSMVTGKTDRTLQLMASYDLANRALRHQKGLGQFTEQTVMNVAGAFNPGSLDLDSASFSQLADLANIYGVKGNTKEELAKGLRETGPILGRGIPYYGPSRNPFEIKRMAMARAVIDLSKRQKQKGHGSLVFGVTPESEDVRDIMKRQRLSAYGFGYSDFRQALDLVSDTQTGRLLSEGNGDKDHVQRIAGRLQDHDRSVELMMEKAAGTSDTESFVDVLYKVVSGAQQVIENTERGSDDYKRAERLRSEVYQTKSLLMPFVQTARDGSKGIISLYDPTEMGGQLRFTGTPAIRLGLDVLSKVPAQFEDHISEVVDRQRQIWEILPEFQSIMDRLTTGPIMDANLGEISVIEEMQRLAIQSQEDAALLFGSVMAQRSQGEKIKYPGVSFVAVADYLATPMEAFVGSRVMGTGLDQVVRDAQASLNGEERRNNRWEAERERLLKRAVTHSQSTEKSVQNKFKLAQRRRMELLRQRVNIRKNLNENVGRLKEEQRVIKKTRERVFKQERGANYQAYRLDGLSQRYNHAQAEIYAARDNSQRELRELNPELNRLRKDTKFMQRQFVQNKLHQFVVEGQHVSIFNKEFIAGIGARDGVVQSELRSMIAQAPEGFVEGLSSGEISDQNYYDKFVSVLSKVDQQGQNIYRAELAGIESAMGHALRDGSGSRSDQRQIKKYMGRRAAFNQTQQIGFDFKPQEFAALQKLQSLTGYVNRAGGPSGGSIVNQQHSIQNVERLKNKQVSEGNQLSLALDGNQTALIVSMYGRFGVQGGDFDGDAYQLVFGFRDIQESLVKSINKRNQMEDSKLALELEMGSGEYGRDVLLRRAQLSNQIRVEQQGIDGLIGKLDNQFQMAGEQISQGVRRHVSSLTGVPLSIMLNKDVYSDEQVSNMIEQQRGITPGLTDFGDSYGGEATSYGFLFNDINQDLGSLNGSLGDYLDTKLEGKPYGLDKAQLSQFKQLTEEAMSKLDLVNSNASERAQAFGVELGTLNNLRMSLDTTQKFIQSAAGTVLDMKSFDLMQDAIGYVGTSLIGEGYNAITSMIGRSTLARTLAHGLGAESMVGLDTAALNLGGQIQERLDYLFAGGEKANTSSNIKEKFAVDEIKRTAYFAQEKSQQISGKLTTIQQMIRDSLKPKEAGGLIGAIVDNSADGEAFREKFDRLEKKEERLDALRNFVSTRAVTSMVDTNERGLINAFGAIFLMADYTKESSPEKMLSDKSDRYSVLRQTRELYEKQSSRLQQGKGLSSDLDTITRLRLQDPEFRDKMVNDDGFLIRQTVVDLINSAAAQETTSKYLGYDANDRVRQANVIREQYIGALASERGLLDASSDFYFKNEQHQMAMMSALNIKEQDILGYTQGQVQNVFSDSNAAFKALTERTFVESTYLGMGQEDLEFSRNVIQAGRSLEFMEFGNQIAFAPFAAAQSENLVAIEQLMRRGKLDDPALMREVQINSSARLFDAIAKVSTKLTSQYGSLESAMSKEEVYKGYSQMAELAGVFDVSRDESNMLSLAMAAKPDGKQSIFEQLADLSAGRANVEEKYNQISDIHQEMSTATGTRKQFLEQHLALLEGSLDSYRQGISTNDTSAVRTALAEIGNKERQFRTDQFKKDERGRRLLIQSAGMMHVASGSQSMGVVNTLGLFAAPVVGAALMSGAGLDERLVLGGYDLMQGLSTAEGFADNKMAQATNSMFIMSRLRQQMAEQESLFLGSVKGVATEALYTGLGGLASQASTSLMRAAGARQAAGGLGSALAEAVVTAAALAFSRKGSQYGVQDEDYSSLMAQSLLDMAQSTENMIQAMIERAQDIEVETEDQIVTFDFDASMAPTEYEERVTAGWIEFSVASDEFDSVYSEIGNYA